MSVKITKEIQDSVAGSPHVQVVHFDATGKQWFNVHELSDGSKNGKLALYGAGIYSHHQVIAGHNPEQVKEIVAKGDPKTKIVESKTREEILSAEIKPEGNGIVSQIMALSAEERQALIALLASPSQESLKSTPPPAATAPPAASAKK